MLESKKLLKEGRWVLFLNGLPQSLEDSPWEVIRITKGGGRVYVQRDNPDTGEKEDKYFSNAMFLVYETQEDALKSCRRVNQLLSRYYSAMKEMELNHMDKLWETLERDSVKNDVQDGK